MYHRQGNPWRLHADALWIAVAGATAATWLLSVVLLPAQTARPPMAEAVFKNVQVLKGIPADDNNLKRTARRMTLMVQEINRANFGGRQVVNGEAAWIAGPPSDRPIPVMPVTGQEREGLAVEGAVFFPARIKETLRNWRVGNPALRAPRGV